MTSRQPGSTEPSGVTRTPGPAPHPEASGRPGARWGNPSRARWLALAARLLAGGVFVGAGVAKVVDIPTTIRSVRAYQLLPEAVVPTFSTALPMVEIAVGVLLVLGLVTRPAAVLTACLSAMFFLGICSAWARGLSIDCGCFGNGGFTSDPVPGYLRELLINGSILIACGWLIARPASRFSLDGALRLSPEPRVPSSGTPSPDDSSHLVRSTPHD